MIDHSESVACACCRRVVIHGDVSHHINARKRKHGEAGDDRANPSGDLQSSRQLGWVRLLMQPSVTVDEDRYREADTRSESDQIAFEGAALRSITAEDCEQAGLGLVNANGTSCLHSTVLNLRPLHLRVGRR